MKNLNWSKMRFICIFLAFSLVILGYFFVITIIINFWV